MFFPRVIPVLLLNNKGLVKTRNFRKPRYIGDPINAVRIFNDKEVDELTVLDIEASKLGKEPNSRRIKELVSEAFMPVAYGGGITNMKQIESLFKSGIEKIILNTAFFRNHSLVTEASSVFGTQSIVVSLDYKSSMTGNKTILFSVSGERKESLSLLEAARLAQDCGAGEILLNNIDKDGMMNGYDITMIREISEELAIPLVACGGAGSIIHMREAIEAGASAVAAGSMFVFVGKHRAVLLNYLKSEELQFVHGSKNHDK